MHTFASAVAETAAGAALAIKTDLGIAVGDLKRDLADLEQRLTIRVGGMLVVAVGARLAALRYLPPH